MSTTPTLGGWSRSQLIELANRRTERRGQKVLDLDSEFIVALHELCMETRWPWRRKSTILTTVAGTWQYDLSAGANAGDLHQFCKHGVKTYPNPGQPMNWSELGPIFERPLQDAIIYANTSGLAPAAPPISYFMMPGQFLMMAINPVPDRAYPIQIAYWSIPRVAPDYMPEAIPLLPHFMHTVLLKKLESQIFRYTLGEGNAKYMAALQEYNALVAKYQTTMGFTPGEVESYAHDDDSEQWQISRGDAVQSTY